MNSYPKHFTPLFFLLCSMLIFIAACSESSHNQLGGDIDLESLIDGDTNDADIVDADNNDSTELEENESCNQNKLSLSVDGLRLDWNCSDEFLVLYPYVQINGKLLGGGENGDCLMENSKLICPVDDFGSLTLDIEGNKIHSWFISNKAVTIEGLRLIGTAKIESATSWLSNGFQSWSQSGMLAIGEKPKDEDFDKALTTIGDLEVLRKGSELSWWYTFAGGGNSTLFFGSLTSSTFKPWTQIYRLATNELAVQLGSGGAGESVTLKANDTLYGESWKIELSQDVSDTLTNYGKSLLSRKNTTPAKPDAGWNSWYEFWDGITETDIKANAEIIKPLLGDNLPTGQPMRVVIDDGWQKAWGVWQANDKFPSGMDGVCNHLDSMGLLCGIWLAPLLVQEDSQIATDNPDWFVGHKFENEKHSYNVFYTHALNGKMLVLDVTHPDAATHLSDVISTITSWGYSLLKIDFLFAGTFEGTRYEPKTGMQAYHMAMNIIREAAGDDTKLLAVGSPGNPSFPYVDAWRLGGDIAFTVGGVSWHYMVNQLRSIASRWFLCYATLCDPDPILERALSQDEVLFGAYVVATAGGMLFLSDDFEVLPEERRTWGLNDTIITNSLYGEPSRPVDIFPTDPPDTLANHFTDSILQKNNHVLPSRWNMPDGTKIKFNMQNAEIEYEGIKIPARTVIELP